MGLALPDKWKKVKLGDYLTVLTDYHANGSYEKLKASVELLDTPNYAVMIRTKNFEQNDFKNDLKYVTKAAYEFLNKSKVYPGDILMNKIANAGSVYCMPDLNRFVSLAMNLFLLRTDLDRTDQRYIYYYLKANESYIKQFAVGTAATTITKQAVRSLNIILPPLPEQKAIARILGTLDDKIELNQQMNRTLEAMAKAIFKSWFVDFDPVRAKKEGRQPAFMDAATADLFPDDFEESSLGFIPKGWSVKRLEEDIHITKGVSYKSSELAPSTVALVTLKSFQRGGGYKDEGLKSYNGKYKPGQVIHPGELIVAYTDVTQSADVIGKPAIVRDSPKYGVLVASCDVGIVRISTENINILFLYYLMSEVDFQNHIYGHTNGSTVLHLSREGIQSYNFCCPPVGLTKSFEKVVNSIIQKCDVTVRENNLICTIRDTLLPKLMSGEIRIKEAEKIVAEVT